MKKTDQSLMRSIRQGDVEGVKAACLGGANPNLTIDGMPVLHIVAIKGMPEMVDALIGCGANVNARDPLELTALMYVSFVASDASHHQVIDRLINLGADVNCKHGPSGRTAIDMAAQFVNAPSVRRLAAAGAKPTTFLSQEFLRKTGEAHGRA